MTALGWFSAPKILALGAAAAVTSLAIAITGAEASGDTWGDAATGTGTLVGAATDATGDGDGTYVEIGAGGAVTVTFDDNVAFDGPGADLLIDVVPEGTVAEALVEVSRDGVTWVPFPGTFSDAADIGINFGPDGPLGVDGLPYVIGVRVSQAAGADPSGFNLDAVIALNQIGEDADLALAPATAEAPILSIHSVTATLTDDAAVVQGPLVSFLVVSGPNAGDSVEIITDAAGEAPFFWTGDGGAGVDVIEAWLDIDGDGTRTGDEPSASATATWRGFTGTIDAIDVDGGGLVVGDLVQVTVTDLDLDITDAADTATVRVFSTTDTIGIVLELTETAADSGVFTGTLTIGDTSDAASHVLAATVGDIVTAEYDDILDATGADPLPVAATLEVIEDETHDGREDKVTLCHLPPGNPENGHTISVGGEAHLAHLAHGDVLGECADDDEDGDHEDGDQEDGDDEDKKDSQLAEFCEEKGNDHPRCDDLSAEHGAQALSDDDDDDDHEDDDDEHGQHGRDKKKGHDSDD